MLSQCGDKRSCYCHSAPMAALCKLVGEILLWCGVKVRVVWYKDVAETCVQSEGIQWV